mgnify:CR=1 FL=1|jgi:hypothetical protein
MPTRKVGEGFDCYVKLVRTPQPCDTRVLSQRYVYAPISKTHAFVFTPDKGQVTRGRAALATDSFSAHLIPISRFE